MSCSETSDVVNRIETTQLIRRYQNLNMGVRKRRRELQDREEWRVASEEAKIHQGL